MIDSLVLSPYFLQLLFTYLGPVCSIGLQVSSYFTAQGIVEKKSVGKFSVVPFGSLFVNSLVWELYGILKLDSVMVLSNILGVLIGLYCLWAFNNYATLKPMKEYFVVTVVSTFCVVLANMRQTDLIGFLGCLFSIILSGAPLAVVGTVIKEQNTTALPFWTSLVTWIGNLAWIGYGVVVTNDPWVYLPNSVGALLSSFQMLLFLWYPSKTENNTITSV